MLITCGHEKNDRFLLIFLIRKGVSLNFCWKSKDVSLLLAFPAGFNGSSGDRLKSPLSVSPHSNFTTLEEADDHTNCPKI